ncbi:MAG: squalene synthase HpnC [Gammaproteobacteria bacterium]|nr:squalene synthase HpnC [Gammaproteobacteria bacterium]
MRAQSEKILPQESLNSLPLKRAYQSCLAFASSHYENFPVASLLLPRALRLPVAAIYAFARCADDSADEGEKSPEERLSELNIMESRLYAIENGENFTEPFWMALAHTIRHHSLPLEPFLNLLKAFKQDVLKNRYATFQELLDYCCYSANPIGTLLLKLVGQDLPQNREWSDSICTALQLINFIQDVGVDSQLRNRIYIPLDEIQAFGVSEAQFHEHREDASMKALMQFQGERARAFLLKGQPLAKRLPGRLGLELRCTICGGKRILKVLSERGRSVFQRPKLKGLDWVRILFSGIVLSRLI